MNRLTTISLITLLLASLIGSNAPAFARSEVASGGIDRADPEIDTWHRDIIDPYGASPWTTLALDATGQPHVSYVGHDGQYRYSLKYAFFDGTDWQIQSVDDQMATGWFPSLALDSLDEPQIAYHHAHDKLVYAHFYNGSWHIQTVDSGGDVGEQATLSIDSADRPHIAYTDETANLVKYARRTGATWQISTVAAMPAATQQISLDMVLDRADRPHICYYDELANALKHAYFNGVSWQFTTVAANLISYNGQSCSIVVDSNNLPRISFRDIGLFYARQDGAQWRISEVDNGFFAGQESALALDAHNRPRIAYGDWDYPNNDLRYAYFDGYDWQIETVHSTTLAGAQAQGISLALDDAGSPHISYYMDPNGPPQHAWKTVLQERWFFLPAVMRH